jgi:hypothetical protein
MAHETREQSLDVTDGSAEVVLEKPGDDSTNIRIRPPGNGEEFDVQVSDREGSWLDEDTTLTGDTDLKLTLTERFVRVAVATTGSGGTADVLISSGGAE